jgi:hypothetical protein
MSSALRANDGGMPIEECEFNDDIRAHPVPAAMNTEPNTWAR